MTLAKQISRLITGVCLLAIVITWSGCATGGVSYSDDSIPERPEYTLKEDIELELKKPRTWVLKNGLTVMFQPDFTLPLVSGSFLFEGGSLNEGEGNAGLASATGHLLREGGIEGIPPTELDQTVERLAISIESSMGEEHGSVSFSGLSENFDEILSLTEGVIRRPAFDEERFELWQSIALEGLKRRAENPSAIAQVASNQLMFGLSSPLASITTSESLRKLNPERLRAYYQSLIRPNGSLLVITGAVEQKQVKELVQRLFGKWEPVDQPIPARASAVAFIQQEEFQPGIYVIEAPFEQAAIFIQQTGPARLSPDHYRLAAFNRYFGGGSFGNILFSRIRSQQGLAYAVGGGFSPGVDIGTFYIYVGTRVEESIRALRAVFETIADVQGNPPDQELFNETMNAVERAFVFQFATPAAIASRAALLHVLRYPENYDQTYLEHLKQVELEDIRKVAQTRIAPSNQVVLVVGRVNAKEFAQSFGETHPVYRLHFNEYVRKIERVAP